MLNFAERTGSGAVILVWSFLIVPRIVAVRLSCVTGNFKTESPTHSTPYNQINECGIVSTDNVLKKRPERGFVSGKTCLYPDKHCLLIKGLQLYDTFVVVDGG